MVTWVTSSRRFSPPTSRSDSIPNPRSGSAFIWVLWTREAKSVQEKMGEKVSYFVKVNFLSEELDALFNF